MYQIKEFSQKTGLSVRMLRYIEDMGLLMSGRTEKNYRVYKNTQIIEAKLISKLQSLGFQLREIKNLFDKVDMVKTVESVLQREVDIAELKSDSIPELRALLDYVHHGKEDLASFFETEKPKIKKMTSLWGEEKFHRTAYSIPILRTIYEDHMAIDTNIELEVTDLMKFGQWISELDYTPEVFSAFNESSFFYGKNLTQDFIAGYEKAWSKFLPDINLSKLESFSINEVKELMGTHDVIIRTQFSYKDSGASAEIVIPYTPIYTMTQLKFNN